VFLRFLAFFKFLFERLLQLYIKHHCATVRGTVENNEAPAEVTTANGGTFTLSSARLSSQSRYSTLDR